MKPKNIAVGSLSLLQHSFPTQESHCGFLHWRQILYQLSYEGSPFSLPVQFSSVTQSCVTLCDPMNHSTPGLPVHHQLPEFTQTDVHRVGDAIQPSHPLSFSSPPAPIPLSIRVISNESTLRMRWPKYWNFSFSIIPSKKLPGLISFRMVDLLAVQGTLKSLFQHHSSKASILWCSTFFTVQTLTSIQDHRKNHSLD